MENLSHWGLIILLVYISLTVAVAFYGMINKVGFRIGFIWSLCFTPIFGLFLVIKNISIHKK
jgi:hypothetical protein